MPDEKPMGAVLVADGKCPLGWKNERSCFYCPFGNPTWCHFPRRHPEAGCRCRKYLVPVETGGEDHGHEYSPHELF